MEESFRCCFVQLLENWLELLPISFGSLLCLWILLCQLFKHRWLLGYFSSRNQWAVLATVWVYARCPFDACHTRIVWGFPFEIEFRHIFAVDDSCWDCCQRTVELLHCLITLRYVEEILLLAELGLLHIKSFATLGVKAQGFVEIFNHVSTSRHWVNSVINYLEIPWWLN